MENEIIQLRSIKDLIYNQCISFLNDNINKIRQSKKLLCKIKKYLKEMLRNEELLFINQEHINRLLINRITIIENNDCEVDRRLNELEIENEKSNQLKQELKVFLKSKKEFIKVSGLQFKIEGNGRNNSEIIKMLNEDENFKKDTNNYDETIDDSFVRIMYKGSHRVLYTIKNPINMKVYIARIKCGKIKCEKESSFSKFKFIYDYDKLSDEDISIKLVKNEIELETNIKNEYLNVFIFQTKEDIIFGKPFKMMSSRRFCDL
ncbi:hypothetical protein BCR36DRAFT_581869 [Piromyces finnis]|uniref:Uncharacterized protein n=1 Tax=Piromyces finnis TaxID=1754191 RepID=A0A1Y1VFM0_9FUNG|nr:hypothetical protein BCR36DRAFT_581869 [Piromyces finnis]|eukprot:ORX54242.1 hypothetical protein BCR36DRAFT_581869 [Piromyces finnis]